MGSLAKVFFFFFGNSAESSRKLRFIAPGKGAEILRKFRGNLRKFFCDDPFPNDPISELLKINALLQLQHQVEFPKNSSWLRKP